MHACMVCMLAWFACRGHGSRKSTCCALTVDTHHQEIARYASLLGSGALFVKPHQSNTFFCRISMAPPASRRPPRAPVVTTTAAGKTVTLLGKPKQHHNDNEKLPPPPKEVRGKRGAADTKKAALEDAAKRQAAAQKANAEAVNRKRLPLFMAAGASQPLANLSRACAHLHLAHSQRPFSATLSPDC